MTTTYTLGFLSTPKSALYNTYVGPRTIENLPDVLDFRKDLPPVRDQGRQGSCVAQAGACMKEWQEQKDVGYNDYMSPQYIYNLRSNRPSEGMYFQDLMNILTQRGVCREYLYPYGSTEEIPTAAHDDAANFKIKTYARIDEVDLNRVKMSLFTNGPCVIALPTYNYRPNFWNQHSGDSYLGGHAVTIVGWNQDCFIIRNSWGSNWGYEGYTYFPFIDFQARKYFEIWTTVDDESHVIPPNPKSHCKCCTLI